MAFLCASVPLWFAVLVTDRDADRVVTAARLEASGRHGVSYHLSVIRR